MALHAQICTDTGLAVYFCDSHSWPRGSPRKTLGWKTRAHVDVRIHPTGWAGPGLAMAGPGLAFVLVFRFERIRYRGPEYLVFLARQLEVTELS